MNTLCLIFMSIIVLFTFVNTVAMVWDQVLLLLISFAKYLQNALYPKMKDKVKTYFFGEEEDEKNKEVGGQSKDGEVAGKKVSKKNLKAGYDNLK